MNKLSLKATFLPMSFIKYVTTFVNMQSFVIKRFAIYREI